MEQQATALATSLAQRRNRFILRTLAEAEQDATGKAAVLAAMMSPSCGSQPDLCGYSQKSSRNSEQVIAKGKSRFRCVSWDVLRKCPEIMRQGPLRQDNDQKTKTDVFTLSEPCNFGEADVFVSHSNYDDADLKWKALEKWCESFRRQHGRAPRLWLDKVCIDQTDIASDLLLLPVFLAACQGLLIVCGPTYTSRLWCILELFVYFTVTDHHDQDKKFAASILPLGETDEEKSKEMKYWEDFNVSRCQCFDPEDEEKIMKLIGTGPGGLPSFDEHVAELAREVAAYCC